MVSPADAREAVDPTPPEPASARPRRAPGPADWAFVLGLVTILAVLAFPFAPVTQIQARYTWDADTGPAAAIPLMPYQPISLTATIGCDAVRAAAPGTTLFSTVPADPDPQAVPMQGLDLVAAPGPGLLVRSAGVDLGTTPVGSGPCTFSVGSGPARTQVLRDGTPVLTVDGDVRPAVVGAFTDVPPGPGAPTLDLVADTRFETSIGPLKAALGTIAVLGLVGTLVALRRCDQLVLPRVRLFARPRRPRAVDAVVALLLALWWWIGPVTVDDGYIAGMVRSPDGFIGNAYRWLNAPEAPFSWYDELLREWASVSTSMLWLRLPSTLLGLVAWLLLSRAVLPRLGRFAARRSTPWIAAAAFAAWWLPFELGLRPEPWVAVGTLVALVAVERAVARRAVLPLAVALVAAGLTTTVTPGGVIAYTPVLAAAVPLVRLLRTRRDLHRFPLAVGLLAAAVAPALLTVYDQSLAAMLESVRIRRQIGGGVPWYEEFQRYQLLLTPGDFQGSLAKRLPVLLTLAAAAGVVWTTLGRGRSGIAAGPTRRLLAGFVLSVLALTTTPTKWTQQFGVLAGVGAAVLVVALVGWTGAALRVRTRGRTLTAVLAGTAVLTVVGALVLSGTDTWPFVSGWYVSRWDGLRILGRTPVVLWTGVGVLVVVVVAGWAVWRATGDRATVPAAPPRWVPAPATAALVLVGIVLAVQVLGFGRTALRAGWTVASDAAATVRGQSCGLERDLLVETDPAAGVLPAVGPFRPTLPTVAADVGGRELPGIAVAGVGSSAWLQLDPAQRDGGLPVVVTTTGSLRPGDSLLAEFAAAPDGPSLATLPVPLAGGTTPTDARLMAPPGASVVRLSVHAPIADGAVSTAVASIPRVPRLTPMSAVLPAGTSAILDWPVAFAYGCLTPARIADGSAGLPQWRVGPPAADDSAAVTYSPVHGGPFATPRLLVTEQRMAMYVVGNPTRDPGQLYHWQPRQPMTTVTPVVSQRAVSGLHSDGRIRLIG